MHMLLALGGLSGTSSISGPDEFILAVLLRAP